ncbi:MAG: 30S ribosomal protein S20 [Elusimicrobia bacterium]|nr:30S ribosomal protein S20 [Elusimicrobiota bacterium]
MAKIKKTGRHTGAIKTARQALKRRRQNYFKKEQIKAIFKTAVGASTAKDKPKIITSLSEFSSKIDKAVKTGLLHWRTAARRKSYLARMANGTGAAPKAGSGASPKISS